MRFAALLLGAALVAAAPAAGGYRNPTPGRKLVLQIPGMHRAEVRRGIVFRKAGGRRLRMDVYRPRRARGRLPVVLVGASPGSGRRSGQKVGWAQLIAASGMAAVTFDLRSDAHLAAPDRPTADVAAAIAAVRARSRALRIDPSRMCTLGFALDTAPWQLAATMHDPKPYLRCNVVFYGALDLAPFGASVGTEEAFSPLSALRHDGSRTPPLLAVRAGRDATPGLNESIDAFAAAARAAHADVRVIAHPTAGEGFDVGKATSRSRAVVREALRFLRSRLSRPLRFRDGCGTAAERARVLRFFAADDTRLLGLQLGGGDLGVVLVHESRASLCNWLPYARELAAAGYNVLAYDSRDHASSGPSPAIDAGRNDLDVVAAVEALRRKGATTVALGGASLGGTSVLVGAAELPEPAAGVVSLSGPNIAGSMEADVAVQSLQAPLLFVAGEDDAGFVEDARELYTQAVSPDRTLAIVPGGDHGTQLLRHAAVHDLVTAFLTRVLGRPDA